MGFIVFHIVLHDCSEFPAVQQALLFNTFVDDICVGADTEKDAMRVQSIILYSVFFSQPGKYTFFTPM